MVISGAFIRAAIAKSDSRPWSTSGTMAFATSLLDQSHRNTGDLRDFKIRVPVSPLWISMFRAFNASPISINLCEIYSALKNKLAEGQENPLAVISTAKRLRGAEILLADSHMWDGYWFLANRHAWDRLPADLQKSSRRTGTRPRWPSGPTSPPAQRVAEAGPCLAGPRLQRTRPRAFSRSSPRGGLLLRVDDEASSFVSLDRKIESARFTEVDVG